MIFNLGPSGSRSIEFIANGTTYRYTGTEISNSYFKISPSGTNGWKMWIYASITIIFNYLATVDIWAIGKGGNGGASFHETGGAYGGGGGGGGGQVVSVSGATMTVNSSYSVVVGSSGSSFGSIVTAGNGRNGSSPNGGASGGGSGAGSTGEWVNDHSWPPSSGGGGNGGEGVYAFADSSFDGVRYGHGGGGGYHSGGAGASYTAKGSGGAGAGGSYGSATAGIVGIVCLRSAA